MELRKLTNRLQDLCHEGFATLNVAVLDEDMHEHLVKDVRISPNRKVWITVERNGKEESNNED